MGVIGSQCLTGIGELASTVVRPDLVGLSVTVTLDKNVYNTVIIDICHGN